MLFPILSNMPTLGKAAFRKPENRKTKLCRTRVRMVTRIGFFF